MASTPQGSPLDAHAEPQRAPRRLRHRQEPGARRPPLAGYGVVVGVFGAALGTVSLLERRLGRSATPVTPLDAVLLAGATFKAARVVSRERVGSVVRAPFVEERAGGEARPSGTGLRRALGELVTCSRCAGTWAALGLVSSRVVAPRFGRLLTTTLAAGAANDFLQAGFVALCARADEEPAPHGAGRGGR